MWAYKSFFRLKKFIVIVTHNYYVPHGSVFYHNNVHSLKKYKHLIYIFKAVPRPVCLIFLNTFYLGSQQSPNQYLKQSRSSFSYPSIVANNLGNDFQKREKEERVKKKRVRITYELDTSTLSN